MREESEILGQIGKVALLRGPIDGSVPVKENLVPQCDAAAFKLEQPQNGQQHAGLAGAVGPYQRQGLGANLQRGLQQKWPQRGFNRDREPANGSGGHDAAGLRPISTVRLNRRRKSSSAKAKATSKSDRACAV